MNEMATSMIIALINILILAGISFKFLGVAVTFKLLNVVLLFAIGGYLFVKHLLPFIKDDILSKKQTQKKMKENAHNLDLERKDLLEDIEQQKDCIKSLDLKLSAWKANFERAKEKRKKEKKDITRTMHERAQKQFEHMESDYTRELVFPEAIDEAEAELIKEFSNKKAGEAFLANILKAMNKQ